MWLQGIGCVLLLLAISRVIAERRARRWSAEATRLGLVHVSPDRLEGRFDRVLVVVHVVARWGWTRVRLHPGGSLAIPPAEQRSRLQQILAGQRPPQASDPWLARALADPIARTAGLRALAGLDERTPALACTLRRGAPSDLEHVLRVLSWLVRELSPEAVSSFADASELTSRSPQRRLAALESALGGWSRTSDLDRVRLALARRASVDPDPWVRTLGALHLGLEGVPLLTEIVSDREAPDALVSLALRGLWEPPGATVLIRLLDRADPSIVRWAADALSTAEHPAALWALQRRLRRGQAHPSIAAAVEALEARLGARGQGRSA